MSTTPKESALREQATDASLEWSDRRRRDNPNMTYAETLAYASGWRAGYRAALRAQQRGREGRR